ncbi:MAG: hypothetical protein D6732_20870 [Methanobacteriota archaeon]|nr:MAG: hypothetical protein D6732_20870 [Euryarchaeota archaeon]
MEKKDPLILGVLLRLIIIWTSFTFGKRGIFANPYFDGILDFGDIKFVWEQYAEWTWEGYVPYNDFNIEFPPLFIVIIIVPYAMFKTIGIWSYEIWFAIWITLADSLIIKVLKTMSHEKNLEMARSAAWIWAMFPPIPLLLLARFDSWPILFLLLAIKFDREEKISMASICAMLGAWIKFFPGLYLIAIFMKVRARRKKLSQALVGSFIGSLPTLGFVLFHNGSIQGLLWIVKFHMAKGPYPASFPAFTSLIFGSPPYFKEIFLVVYLLSILGAVSMKPNEQGMFLSLSIFAVFNWHFTPQYFLWSFPLAFSQKKKVLSVNLLVYTIAFGIQTYVNIFSYTVPGYIPKLK